MTMADIEGRVIRLETLSDVQQATNDRLREQVNTNTVASSANSKTLASIETSLITIQNDIAELKVYMHNGPGSQMWPKGLKGKAVLYGPSAGFATLLVGVLEFIRLLLLD